MVIEVESLLTRRLVQIVLFSLVVSCTDYKREMFYCIDEMQCPWVIIDVTNGTDTMMCMTTTTDLYNQMNVKSFNSHIAFSDFLYRELYSKGKPLWVSVSLYDELRKDEVRVVPEVEKIYRERGIEGLLADYQEGSQLVCLMDNDYASFKYFVYLCWLNDTFWFIPEPYYIAVYWSKSWIENDSKWKAINKIWYLFQRERRIRDCLYYRHDNL